MNADLAAPDPWRRASAALVAGILLAAVGACALLPPGWDAGFTICPFKSLTALPCPLCGMTHAFVWLAHGRLAEAVAANALSPVLLAGVLWVAGRGVAVAMGQAVWPPVPRAAYVALLVVTLGWWGLRVYLVSLP